MAMTRTNEESDREEEKSDDVSTKFPSFEFDSPDKTEDSLEGDKTGQDESDEVSGNNISTTVEFVNKELDSKVGIRVSNNNDTDYVFDIKTVESKRSLEGVSVDSSVDVKMETRVSEEKAGAVREEDFDEKSEDWSSEEMKEDDEMAEKSNVLDFNSAYSTVDEGNDDRMTEAFGLEAEKAMSFGFEPGDMVWGKVKSHPWWPGQVFSEAYATTSVRRSKRVGHVLVAFFGDSSYGWFDPAELIPFEPNYSEKSQQTTMRIFVRAVEEAVDEVRRRASLGLVCCCRNPHNFRPTIIRGQFTVDVLDYEGGTYSVKEIKNARDSFQPGEALSFVQQLAANPRDYGEKDNERKGIDWIRNVATFLALRKETYEEFDETYSQAFGGPSARPDTSATRVLDQAAKVPLRAPLSGPLVIAEALGEKGFTKSSKVKDKVKKDKFLLKRRDKPNVPKGPKLSKGHAGTVAMAPGDYVFKKRTPSVSKKPSISKEHEGVQTVNCDGVGVAKSSTDISTVIVEGSSGFEDTDVSRQMSDKGMRVGDTGTTDTELDGSIALMNSEASGTLDSANQKLEKADVYLKLEESTSQPRKSEGLEQPEQLILTSEGYGGLDQVSESGDGRDILEPLGAPPFPVDAKLHKGASGMSSDTVVKKAKVLKRPMNLSTDKTIMGEKKKKRKKQLGSEDISDQPPKRLKKGKDGEFLRKSTGKLQLDPQKKMGGANSTIFSDSLELSPKDDPSKISVELPELLDDLLGLAVDPFYGVGRNSPTIVRHVLLQLRTLVYQKSLVLVPTNDPETSNFNQNKSLAGAGPCKIPSGENAIKSSARLPKPLPRPDDPTKAGQKRSLSERQEEKSAKKLKKMSELKSLTAEKKGGILRVPEPKQAERKEAGTGGVFPVKPTKTATVTKRHENLQAKVPGPAMLSMMFPPRTSLPSPAELKARFARFGPLDHSLLRVFWKSSTCRVVFKNKSHAVAAYDYAVRNRGLFGNVKVNYQLKDVVPAESATKSRPDDIIDEYPTTRQTQQKQHSAVQLKSCLKKPIGEETTGSVMGSIQRENNPRVKFKLGVEESAAGGSSSRGEELMLSNNSSSSASDGSFATSSFGHGMDINSKNFQKFIPPPLPPASLLPLQPPLITGQGFMKIPQYNELDQQRTTTHTIATNISMNKVDISSEMLNLMLRCNDIVRDLNSSFGYFPYHSL
ncbi:uncharacterized protein LOC113301782 isoform X1 [Papaver somniferum]|uniref:uncharacterized protein LOC113301782 isoform X1 n=1 Tax=Papaver somniferum TaxID=3469 RepID=UPI000E6FC4B1|nr:uncharacterized protein LOC113301782 isoform X1 [Papaver somniferum]